MIYYKVAFRTQIEFRYDVTDNNIICNACSDLFSF
jgi:hypothetical protein